MGEAPKIEVVRPVHPSVDVTSYFSLLDQYLIRFGKPVLSSKERQTKMAEMQHRANADFKARTESDQFISGIMAHSKNRGESKYTRSVITAASIGALQGVWELLVAEYLPELRQ